MKFLLLLPPSFVVLMSIGTPPQAISAQEISLLVRTNGENVYLETDAADADDTPSEGVLIRIHHKGELIHEGRTNEKGHLCWTAPSDGDYEAKAICGETESPPRNFRVGPVSSDQAGSPSPPISQTIWFKTGLILVGILSFLGCLWMVLRGRTSTPV